MGGLAFWLPYIVLAAVSRENAGLFWLNAASLLGLTMLGLVSWTRLHRVEWGWLLAGVYILGPISVFTESAISGRFQFADYHSWLVAVLFCLFPPVTLWLSLNNGMFLSVLIATFLLGGVVVTKAFQDDPTAGAAGNS